jgi:hypothetical protein
MTFVELFGALLIFSVSAASGARAQILFLLEKYPKKLSLGLVTRWTGPDFMNVYVSICFIRPMQSKEATSAHI